VGGFLFFGGSGVNKIICLRGDSKSATLFLFCEAKAKIVSWGREIFMSRKILVTDPPPCLRGDSKGNSGPDSEELGEFPGLINFLSDGEKNVLSRLSLPQNTNKKPLVYP
jgi:hypothetical protein